MSITQDISPKNAIKYQNCINVQNVTAMTGINVVVQRTIAAVAILDHFWPTCTGMKLWAACFQTHLLSHECPSWRLSAKSLLTVQISYTDIQFFTNAFHVMSSLKTYAHTLFKALQWCRNVMTVSKFIFLLKTWMDSNDSKILSVQICSCSLYICWQKLMVQ